MAIPVNATPGTLPSDCYPAPQTLNEQILNLAQFEVDESFSGIVKSATEPDVDQRDYMWFNTTDHHWYEYSGGNWVRPHPSPAGGQERRLWVGTEAELWSYDGGDGSNPGVVIPTGATGAMWQVDTDFNAKFLIGVGTLPSGTAVNVGSTGGEETHVLTEAEGAVGNHTHPVGLFNQSGGGNADDAYFNKTGITTVPSYQGRYITGGNGVINTTLTQADIHTLKAGTDGAGVTTAAHNNLPPYRGLYVIKRTGRTSIKA